MDWEGEERGDGVCPGSLPYFENKPTGVVTLLRGVDTTQVDGEWDTGKVPLLL